MRSVSQSPIGALADLVVKTSRASTADALYLR